MSVISEWLRRPLRKKDAVLSGVVIFGFPMAVVLVWFFNSEGAFFSVVLVCIALLGGYVWGLLMWHLFLEAYARRKK